MRLALAVTLFCTVAWAPLARAQADGGVITADDLHEDFRVFRTALEESHAGLYWYVTPDQLGQSLQAALDTLDRPMTAREFYRLLLPVVGALGHGHTMLTLPTRGVGYRLRSLDAARCVSPVRGPESSTTGSTWAPTSATERTLPPAPRSSPSTGARSQSSSARCARS